MLTLTMFLLEDKPQELSHQRQRLIVGIRKTFLGKKLCSPNFVVMVILKQKIGRYIDGHVQARFAHIICGSDSATLPHAD